MFDIYSHIYCLKICDKIDHYREFSILALMSALLSGLIWESLADTRDNMQTVIYSIIISLSEMPVFISHGNCSISTGIYMYVVIEICLIRKRIKEYAVSHWLLQ